MATPRRPYVSVRLGHFEDVLTSGVSSAAALLLARLLTNKSKRSIPGLVDKGPRGLSETLRMPDAALTRQLAELEGKGFVLVDRQHGLTYCVGAVDADPPRVANSVRGMATQLRELPARSPITRVIRTAIEASLTNDDKTSAWLPMWREIVGPEPAEPCPESQPELGPESGDEAHPESGPLRSRSHFPIPHSESHISAFERFWAAYPRKVGKDAARKAFDRRKPDEEILKGMLEAIAEQCQSLEWRKDSGQFIPHPSTWLNQGRWQDEGIDIGSAQRQLRTETLWLKVLDELQPRVPSWDFAKWFSTTREIEHDGHRLIVSVDDAGHAGYLRKYYGVQMREAMAGAGVELELIFRPPSTSTSPPETGDPLNQEVTT